MDNLRRKFIKNSLKSTLSFFSISMLSGFSMKGKSWTTSDNKKQNKSMVIKEIKHNKPLNISKAEKLLESNAEFQFIETINWTKYPYKPEVKFKIAHCQNQILLKYYVKEESVLAKVSTINGSVHKDSCVEFFISPQPGEPYYNFEFNCIGIPHVAVGESWKDRQLIDPNILQLIKTKPTLGNQPFEEKTGGQQWELMLVIPSECFVNEAGLVLKGLKSQANLYKCADDTVKPHFVTWNPVGTENPDYHQPKYFGEVMFE